MQNGTYNMTLLVMDSDSTDFWQNDHYLELAALLQYPAANIDRVKRQLSQSILHNVIRGSNEIVICFVVAW